MTLYDQETKDRVVRMFIERREEAPEESQEDSYRRLFEVAYTQVQALRRQAA